MQEGSLKKTNKKATKWLEKAGFLEKNYLETINYNNDVNLDDVATVDYNNDTNPSNLNNDIEKMDLKKKSATRNAAKEIIKKI